MKPCSERCRRGRARDLRAFGEQARTHACELTHFHAQMMAYRDGLRAALEMLQAARAGEWTPADDVRVLELRILLGGKLPNARKTKS